MLNFLYKKSSYWIFISLLVFNFASIHIPSLGIRLSFETLILLSLGFIYSFSQILPLVLLSDLVGVFLRGATPSIFFLLQPIVTLLLSSFVKYLYLSKKKNQASFYLISLSFLGWAVSLFLFPDLSVYLLAILLLSLVVFFFGSESLIYVLLSLVLCSYLVSFILGTIGAFYWTITPNPLLFFKVRVIKELLKILLFLFPLNFVFSKYVISPQEN